MSQRCDVAAFGTSSTRAYVTSLPHGAQLYDRVYGVPYVHAKRRLSFSGANNREKANSTANRKGP